MQASETSSNATYTLLFTGLPLLVILPFIRYLFLSTTRSMALLCLLSITSLVSSAYIMYMIPLGTPLGSLSKVPRTTPSPQQRRDHAFTRTSFLLTSDESPINQFLPYLNAFISVLLFLASWAYRSRTGAPDGFWVVLLFPGVIFVMVFMARRSMADIQTGLSDLRGMRYEYKGA